ncbi:MAG: DUF4270 domain-containing protein [Flavobacteriaceae bacterium]|nr:DUF4270 domain-containing protein [Flavobacteriaceae bacterium]
MKNIFKTIVLPMFAIALMSCEKDIEIGASIVDQNQIKRDGISTTFTAKTVPVDKVFSSGLNEYLFGVYSKNQFGTLSTDVVSQLSLPRVGSNYTYGKQPIIDSVLITIPYASKLKKDAKKKEYELDSIYGDKSVPFKVSIYELKTFLNTLNPKDPSKPLIYESNKEFKKGDKVGFVDSFKVNENDTIAYINRYDASHKKYKTDTIKEDKSKPFISIPLDKNLIKEKLVDVANSSDFVSQDAFKHYFRGLYISTEVLNSVDSHIAMLSFKGAKMRIFYSNLVNESASEDLNGNGTKGEKDVRVAKNYSFFLSGVKSNVYKRKNKDFSNNKRLYVQGASGAKIIADIFSELDIIKLRSTPHLVTQAKLTFYVDETLSDKELPEQLFIYNDKTNEKLVDTRYSKDNLIGGYLEKTDDGKPYKYVFKITRHIADLLKSNATGKPDELAIRVFNPTDNIQSINTLNYNWNVKGVVLHSSTSENKEKRPTFEIFYSGLKE